MFGRHMCFTIRRRVPCHILSSFGLTLLVTSPPRGSRCGRVDECRTGRGDLGLLIIWECARAIKRFTEHMKLEALGVLSEYFIRDNYGGRMSTVLTPFLLNRLNKSQCVAIPTSVRSTEPSVELGQGNW